MCVRGTDDVLGNLLAVARETLDRLASPSCAPAGTVAQLESMLSTGSPLIVPVDGPVAGKMHAAELLGHEVSNYARLLADAIGPPARVAIDPEMGYVAAECALVALRSGDVRATHSMLFLASLCAPSMCAPAEEAIHHLLAKADRAGRVGLLVVGLRTQEAGAALAMSSRAALDLMFAVTAVQLLGAWHSRLSDTGVRALS